MKRLPFHIAPIISTLVVAFAIHTANGFLFLLEWGGDLPNFTIFILKYFPAIIAFPFSAFIVSYIAISNPELSTRLAKINYLLLVLSLVASFLVWLAGPLACFDCNNVV